MLTMIKFLRSRLLRFLLLGSLTAAVLSLYVLFGKDNAPAPHKMFQLLPKELYKLISPLTYKYLLNQPELCLNRKPLVILMIPVTVQDSESRKTIRNTWGQDNLVPNVDIARVFFIGHPITHDAKLEQDLQKESVVYRDIVQMDFLDTYYNLTIKTMMIMDWVSKYCRSAQYAMKIDADIFLNVPYLVNHLHRKSRFNYITGSVIRDGRPRRNPNSKWYLSEDVYPENTFPPFVSGAGYVFSVDLAKKISMASKFVRPIPLEDVYVGLCLDFLQVRPQFAMSLFPYRNLFDVRRLDYDRCTFAKLIIVNGFTSSELMSMWSDFQSAGFSCGWYNTFRLDY